VFLIAFHRLVPVMLHPYGIRTYFNEVETSAILSKKKVKLPFLG